MSTGFRHPGLPQPPKPPRRPRPLGQADPYALKYEPADASAVKAVWHGTATPEDCKRAMQWILLSACSMGDWAYKPGLPQEATQIALGRQFVGGQIMALVKMDLAHARKQMPQG